MPEFMCILTTDSLDVCSLCGGWLHADGGPFDPPDGGPRYCSEDCWEDAVEFAARRRSDWCPSCGFDRFEHAPDCVTPPVESGAK